MGGWVENNKEKDHGCTHEQDFIASQDDRNELFRRSDEKFKTLEFIKGELILIKDALGVKNKDNGTRDKQIQDIIDKTTELEKLTDEGDNNLAENITQLQYDMSEIKGFLKGYFQQKKDDADLIGKEIQNEHIKSAWYNDKITVICLIVTMFAVGFSIGLAFIYLH